ncbi:unnamed protein product [Amaranthus hypochondriacus]
MNWLPIILCHIVSVENVLVILENNILQKRLDEERLQDFLFGVNVDIYGHMRSTILSQDPLPPFDRVYQMFLQEERLHFVAENHSEQAAIRPMAVKSNISRSHIPLICTHCHRKGHDEPNCWTKHGVPDRWELRNPRGGSRGGARGNRGGGRGAIQHHRNNNGRGQHNVAAVTSGEVADALDTSGYSYLSRKLTPVQWQQLIDLLGNSSLPNNERLSGPSLEDADLLGCFSSSSNENIQ